MTPTPSQAGRFIALEGGEGVGKSTQMTALKCWLESRGLTVLATREPGGTPLGEQLRAILLNPDSGVIHPDAELLMMYAARAQHVHSVILPALASGHWVLCDRFSDASHAYQGAGRGISSVRLDALDSWVLGNMRPDLTLVLDAVPGIGLQRAASARAKDRFEREPECFFQRVREAYLQRAALAPQRYRIVDASLTREEVSARLQAAICSFFGWV